MVGEENKYKGKIEVRRKDINHIIKAIDEKLSIKDRAYGEVEIKNDTLIIKIKAKDANAFRAALNSYLRILQSTENIQKEVR